MRSRGARVLARALRRNNGYHSEKKAACLKFEFGIQSNAVCNGSWCELGQSRGSVLESRLNQSRASTPEPRVRLEALQESLFRSTPRRGVIIDTRLRNPIPGAYNPIATVFD